MIKIKPQGTKSMATGQNIPNPASTFLETGPKDELAGADAYTGLASQFKTAASNAMSGGAGTAASIASGGGGSNNGAETVRRVGAVGSQNLWTALLCGAFDDPSTSSDDVNAKSKETALWLRSTGCSAENLVNLISSEGGGLGLQREEIEKRLSSAIGQSMHTLEPELKESMIQSMANMTGQDASTIAMYLPNGSQNLTSGQQSEASALAKILSNVSGSEEAIEIFDLHAEAAMVGSLLDKAIDLGIPQAAETLLKRINEPSVKRTVGIGRLKPAAINSQLGTVRTIVNEVGADASLARVPDLISLITQNYSMGRNVTTDDYPIKRLELVETLILVDPKWHLKKREGQWVNNLEPFSMASQDALTLFKGSDYELQAMMAPTYPEQRYDIVARKYHPRAAVGYTFA